METYFLFKGFGVTYSSITGTTSVDRLGFVIEVFRGQGEQAGAKLAVDYILRCLEIREELLNL